MKCVKHYFVPEFASISYPFVLHENFLHLLKKFSSGTNTGLE